MSWQGYLRHIVESLASEDEALLALLGGGDDDGGGGPNMKSLYTFESKMAMLTRLAATGAGAELLLESGLMHRYLKGCFRKVCQNCCNAPIIDSGWRR